MTRDDHDPAVRLGLELRPAGDAMTGRLTDERGADWRFSGWLGLLSLLEAARTGTLDQDGATSWTR